MRKEDLDFFKATQGYRRLFTAFRKKYKSLGHIGGTVVLVNLTHAEKEVLSSHFKKDYTRQNTARISLSTFESSLKNTRFEGYSLKQILEAYFGKSLTSKKEDLEILEAKRQKFFDRLFSLAKTARSKNWLQCMYDGTASGARTLKQVLLSDGTTEPLFEIKSVCKALDNLPVDSLKKQRLPVFSSMITQNPHSFDYGSFLGNLFFNALCTIFDIGDVKSSEERAEVYYKAGILVDEISNYITISGLDALHIKQPDPVWRAALTNRRVLQVPLLNLSLIDSVYSPISKVFVVENPGVFETIIDIWGEQLNYSFLPPMVCTYGQLKLSGFVLLDMLAKSQTQIYYSGDFDPEGLIIAERLYKRYKEKLTLWHYNIEDYYNAISNETISQKRLAMLNKITQLQLKELANVMISKKRSGYQEMIINDLINDIKQSLPYL